MNNWIKIEIEDLKDIFIKSRLDKRPMMIAVDGPSGAGKSFFAKKNVQYSF
jgi:pantothenate kinase-related protein Tda10